MQRLPLLAALVVAAIVAASAWLAIDARSDPRPLPPAEHLPRDDDQSQQEGSQAEPQPDAQPDDAEVEQKQSEQDSEQQEALEDEPSESLSEEEAAETEEVPELPANPVDILIHAFDLPHRVVEPALASPPEFTTYIVESGDTLAEIGRRFDVDLLRLIEVNELDAPDLLDIGVELRVPIEGLEIALAADPEAEREPLQWPTEVAPPITTESIVYGTILDHESGFINSAIIALSVADSSIRLVEACVDGVRRSYIQGLSLPDGPTRVYWRFEDGPLKGPLRTNRWNADAGVLEAVHPYPFLNRLLGSEATQSLWIRVGGSDLTFTFENSIPEDLFNNFHICGH